MKISPLACRIVGAVTVAGLVVSAGPGTSAAQAHEGGAPTVAAASAEADVTAADAAAIVATTTEALGLDSGAGAASTTSDAAGSVVVDYGQGYEVAVPSTSENPITVGSADGVQIGIPVDTAVAGAVMANGATVYQDDEQGVSVVVEATPTGGVRQSYVLEGSDSKTSFDVDVELPAGAKLERQPDGSVQATDGSGEIIGGFARPRVVDAAGNSVPTTLSVTPTGIVQTVTPGDSTVYPVVADPWWGTQWELSSKSANRLSALLNGGAGISAIVAAICGGTIVGVPCAAAYGVAAGVLVIGGAVISWCNAEGKGINIDRSWNGWIWCTSR